MYLCIFFLADKAFSKSQRLPNLETNNRHEKLFFFKLFFSVVEDIPITL